MMNSINEQVLNIASKWVCCLGLRKNETSNIRKSLDKQKSQDQPDLDSGCPLTCCSDADGVW
jgi:hypothetical protein